MSETVKCKHCGEDTRMLETQECDRCNELSTRIRTAPDLAEKMLRSIRSVESNLVRHARFELQRAGMYDSDSDYDGMIGECAEELVRTLALQRHSGGSLNYTLAIFDRLAHFKTLTPITSDPAEWMNVSEASGDNPMWQNKRSPSVFSKDGGAMWYDLDNPQEVQQLREALTRSTRSTR